MGEDFHAETQKIFMLQPVNLRAARRRRRDVNSRVIPNAGLHRLRLERQGLEGLGVVLPVHGRELVIITIRRARPQGEALEGVWCFWYSLSRITGFGGEWSEDDHDLW